MISSSKLVLFTQIYAFQNLDVMFKVKQLFTKNYLLLLHIIPLFLVCFYAMRLFALKV